MSKKKNCDAGEFACILWALAAAIGVIWAIVATAYHNGYADARAKADLACDRTFYADNGSSCNKYLGEEFKK